MISPTYAKLDKKHIVSIVYFMRIVWDFVGEIPPAMVASQRLV
jgi:hypothetical protein